LVVSGVSPRPTAVFCSNGSLNSEEGRLMRINTLPGLVVLIGLSLSLTACKDTTTLQENERLKGQVTELQKENTDLTNNLQTVTASRDTLAKENESLTSDLKPKRRRGRKKK
jgi:hypothetical protein